MMWFYLILAGLLEVVWATTMKLYSMKIKSSLGNEADDRT
ncbi:SMR family transporter [Streptococcus orisratti]